MWSRDAIFILHFDLSGGAVLHEEARGKSCNVIWKSAAQLFLFQTPVWLFMVVSGHVKNQLTLIHNSKVLRPRGPENSHFICFFLFSTIAASYKCALQEAVWLQFWHTDAFPSWSGYRCYNLYSLCECVPSHTKEGILFTCFLFLLAL